MNVPITPQQLPSGFCPTTYQEMWNGYAKAGLVQIPDSVAQVIWQMSKPTDPSVTWGQLDSLGRPIRLYRFAQGAWLSLHPQVPGQTVWWFDTLPDFTQFDGGDANAASDISGPMWQQAKDNAGNLIAAMFPIPAGTLPSGTVISLGQKAGEENHTLTSKESFPHTHTLITVDLAPGTGGINTPTNIGPNDSIASASGGGGGSNNAYTLVKGSTLPPSIGLSASSGGDTSVTPPVAVGHNNMPPYIVGYLLQRTSKLFYAVN